MSFIFYIYTLIWFLDLLTIGLSYLVLASHVEVLRFFSFVICFRKKGPKNSSIKPCMRLHTHRVKSVLSESCCGCRWFVPLEFVLSLSPFLKAMMMFSALLYQTLDQKFIHGEAILCLYQVFWVALGATSYTLRALYRCLTQPLTDSSFCCLTKAESEPSFVQPTSQIVYIFL